MKRLLAGAALLACVGYPAYAATFYSWQGDLFITAVNSTAACNAVGLHVGDFSRGVFRPKGLGSNGSNDLLAWHFGRSAGQIAVTGALNGATTSTIRIIYASGGFNQFTNAALTGATVTPSTATINTPTIAISLTIPNAYSSPSPAAPSGCNITIKGTVAKRLV